MVSNHFSIHHHLRRTEDDLWAIISSHSQGEPVGNWSPKLCSQVPKSRDYSAFLMSSNLQQTQDSFWVLFSLEQGWDRVTLSFPSGSTVSWASPVCRFIPHIGISCFKLLTGWSQQFHTCWWYIDFTNSLASAHISDHISGEMLVYDLVLFSPCFLQCRFKEVCKTYPSTLALILCNDNIHSLGFLIATYHWSLISLFSWTNLYIVNMYKYISNIFVQTNFHIR